MRFRRTIIMILCTFMALAGVMAQEMPPITRGTGGQATNVLEILPLKRYDTLALPAGGYYVWVSARIPNRDWIQFAWKRYGPYDLKERVRYYAHIGQYDFILAPDHRALPQAVLSGMPLVSIENFNGDRTMAFVFQNLSGATWDFDAGNLVQVPVPGAVPVRIPVEGRWRGIWEARGLNDPGYTIRPEGEGLVFATPDGRTRSSGVYRDARTVVAKEWGAVGTISPDGMTIRWDNGSHWEREGGIPGGTGAGSPSPAVSSGYPSLAGIWRGVWESRGIDKPGYRILQNGGGLVFVSEDGVTTSSGKFLDQGTVVATDWKATGRIVNGGRTILWDNGSHWER